MNRLYFIVVVLLVSFNMNDVEKQSRKITWGEDKIFENQQSALFFEGCEYIDHETLLPYFVESISLKGESYEVILENTVFEEIEEELNFVGMDVIPDNIKFETSLTTSAASNTLHIKILPFKKEGDKLFKLTGFGLSFLRSTKFKSQQVSSSWANESVLKSGKWVKIKTKTKGIYKIPYTKLQDWGFSSPQNVKVFGNGGYMLSESNAATVQDDLNQLSVWKGQDNGGNDCLYFYANGCTRWDWNQTDEEFNHIANVYSNQAYYFLTEDVGAEKLVFAYPENSSAVTHTVNSFDEYNLHELETFNLVRSGKQWFGEKFINGMSHNISLECKNKESGEQARIKLKSAARSSDPSSMSVTINGSNQSTINYNKVNKHSLTSIHADEKITKIEDGADGGSVDITLRYSSSSSSDEAWLDYIELNYRKQLLFDGSEMFFRDSKSVGPSNIAEFTIQDAISGLKILDVTEPDNIQEVPTVGSGGNLVFKRPSDDLREYVAYNPTGSFPEPEKVDKIANQNLHFISSTEFIIITHPDFVSSANELASFHQTNDGMSVRVVNTEEVYNEFGSGSPDATAIRNFIRMLYQRDNKIKYVLLFGDGSYDNRNINGVSKNFIPTYQSNNSLLPVNSFVTDDYYVILDANESVYNGAVDLGIGRIPASSTYEAQLVINKIKNYYSSESLGDWRNSICFIGDDEDGNTHMGDSEKLANQVNGSHGAFITNKIYFDAFVQESTTAGERYPGVTSAINESVKNGVLILNYVGHANERFLADEHVLDISNINSWSNINNLPIFVTATCEFSRFDDDETTAGEHILFNPNGGGIGLFSTTRVVYSYSNYLLSKNFYNYVFDKDVNGEHYRMGDIMRLAKVATVNTTNKRNFSLLADPALKLSYPKYKVETTSINQIDAQGVADTLQAMSKVTISGIVTDFLDNKLTNFNGKITPTVFDKAFMIETIGNGGERPMEFKVQNSVIYKGLASVTNGDFTFSFVVPKDISYSLGEGRITYYAEDGVDDAHGSFKNFFIGGAAENQIVDNTGPQIELYMDDASFVSGDKTSKNPVMLALISDENGINTVGTGIGHDITAVLDGDYSNSIVLNEYYNADIDNYKTGKLEYPFSNLSIGEHTLLLKVWDVANNSSEVEIKFIVTGEFQIESISNYPNPATDHTSFIFKHNQPDASFKSIIEVFDINGQIVDSFNETISSSGMESNPVWWDIANAPSGLRGGMYFYRITIQASDGAVASKTGKMTIIR